MGLILNRRNYEDFDSYEIGLKEVLPQKYSELIHTIKSELERILASSALGQNSEIQTSFPALKINEIRRKDELARTVLSYEIEGCLDETDSSLLIQYLNYLDIRNKIKELGRKIKDIKESSDLLPVLMGHKSSLEEGIASLEKDLNQILERNERNRREKQEIQPLKDKLCVVQRQISSSRRHQIILSHIEENGLTSLLIFIEECIDIVEKNPDLDTVVNLFTRIEEIFIHIDLLIQSIEEKTKMTNKEIISILRDKSFLDELISKLSIAKVFIEFSKKLEPVLQRIPSSHTSIGTPIKVHDSHLSKVAGLVLVLGISYFLDLSLRSKPLGEKTESVVLGKSEPLFKDTKSSDLIKIDVETSIDVYNKYLSILKNRGPYEIITYQGAIEGFEYSIVTFNQEDMNNGVYQRWLEIKEEIRNGRLKGPMNEIDFIIFHNKVLIPTITAISKRNINETI